MKLPRNVPVPQAKIGTETSVFSASVDKPGTPPRTPVLALSEKPGTDTYVSTHAQVEESSTSSVDNVSAPLVTGTVPHASSALTLKSGLSQDCHVSALKATGMDLPASSVLPTKFGSQPPQNADVLADKTGTASHASPAQLEKIGILPPDYADAQLVKTKMETTVFHASEEENGTLSQNNAPALLETGMASHAFNAPLDKPGTQPASHAPACQALSGTASAAKFAQAPADSGTINLTIVSAEPETGMELNVSSAQSTATGMEKAASRALVEGSGTQSIRSANAQMNLNGMVSDASSPAPTERFFKTVVVSAQLVNSNKTTNVSTTQSVRVEPTGMENNVSKYPAMPVPHSAVAATAVKSQFTPAHLVLIGMVSDASTSQTSVPPV